MAENKPSDDRASWWSMLPALITAISALVTAIGAIYLGILPYRDDDRTEPPPTVVITAPANPVTQVPTPELQTASPTERPPLETPTLPPPTPAQMPAANPGTYTNPTEGYSVSWDPSWQQGEATEWIPEQRPGTGGELALTNGTSTIDFEIVLSNMIGTGFAASECVLDWYRDLLKNNPRTRNLDQVLGYFFGDSETKYGIQYTGHYWDYSDPAGTWSEGRWEARCYWLQGNKLLRVIHFSPASDWEEQARLRERLLNEGLTLPE